MGCDQSLGSIWPDDIYIICDTGQLIEPGATSSTFPTMKNWKIRIIRGGSPLWFEFNSNGSSYFDYTSLSGEVTWSFPPQQNEEFIIQAYKPLK
jgi:hypothetical protein